MSTKIDDFIKSQVDFFFEAIGSHIKDMSKEELTEALITHKQKAWDLIHNSDKYDIVNEFSDKFATSAMFMIDALIMLEIILKRQSEYGIASRRKTQGMH